jgi:ElaB/YqjD/DUF883 family membrane-anchored ribosome-binding protein
MGETTTSLNNDSILDDVKVTVEDNEETPEQIRARIEQTRAELGDTLNALQERLDPERLKEQAQEQIAEQVQSAKDSVREATIGKVGDFMHNASETISEAARPVVEAVTGAAHNVTEAARPKVEAIGQAAHSVGDTASNAGSAVKAHSSSLMETIRQNPVPAAMAAFGIGWLLLKSNSSGPDRPNDNVYHGSAFRDNYDRNPSFAPDAPTTLGNNSDSPLSRAKESVSGAVGSVQDTAANVADTTREHASHVAEAARENAAHLAEAAQEKAHYVSEQAQYKAHQAQDGFSRALQENPLAVGIVAMAIGAAAGLAVPPTEPERQLMGETRDRLMETAGSAARETMGKVQHVASRVMEEAGKAASEAATNVTSAVKETATEAAQEQGLTTSNL